MIKKIEGIIISETEYGDSSKILNVFTKEFGIIGIIAKGARSLKSKLRSVTMRFTYGYFHVYYKENKLSTLITVDIIDELKSLKNDLTLLSYLNYLVELSTQVYKQNNDESIYQNLILTLLKINNCFDPLVMSNILEIKLLEFLGVGLNLDSCVKCGDQKSIITIDGDAGGYLCSKCSGNSHIVNIKTIKLLRMYYYVDIASVTKLDISKDVINEINYFLDKYYERYTGLYLNSKGFLKSII